MISGVANRVLGFTVDSGTNRRLRVCMCVCVQGMHVRECVCLHVGGVSHPNVGCFSSREISYVALLVWLSGCSEWLI